MNRDNLYLGYIRDAIRKIEKFTAGVNAAAFSDDEKTQSAVVLQLMLIGEVSKKLSDATRKRIDLPWKEITGFRDRAIHDYYDMDLDIIWSTVREDIPALKNALLDIA